MLYTNSTLLSNACQQKKPLSSIKLLKKAKRVKPESNIASYRDFVNCVKNLYKTMPASHLQVLRFVIDHSNRMAELNFSYEYIANALGICERTVGRAMTVLKDEGVIFYFWNYRNTNSYYPHKNFLNVKVRSQLKHIIPELGEKTFRVSVDTPINMYSNYTDSELIMDSVFTIKIDVRSKELNIPSSFIFKVVVSKSWVDKRVCARESKEVVKRERKIVMTPTIEKTKKYLKLLPAGECKLLAFPDEAIDYADSLCQGGYLLTTLKNPFSRFIKLCEDYCSQEKIKPNWRKMYETMKLMGISSNSPFVDESEALTVIHSEQIKKKNIWTCNWGCKDCKPGNPSLEHTQKHVDRFQGRTSKISEIPKEECVLHCTQPCRINGNWTEEHQRKFKKGLEFIESMAPFLLKDEVRQKFSAQFGPRTGEIMAQLDISQASTPTTDFKRPSAVLPNLFLANQPISTSRQVQPVTNHHELKIVPATKQIPLAEINPFEGYTDNCYPEANEELEEVW